MSIYFKAILLFQLKTLSTSFKYSFEANRNYFFKKTYGNICYIAQYTRLNGSALYRNRVIKVPIGFFLITLIHTSFSPKTLLQFFGSFGSHNNKKSKKIFFGRLVFVGGRKMCFFTQTGTRAGWGTTVELKIRWLESDRS